MLQGSRLHGSRLSGSRLQGSMLQDSRLQGSRLHDSRLHDSRLQGSRLQGITGPIPRRPVLHPGRGHVGWGNVVPAKQIKYSIRPFIKKESKRCFNVYGGLCFGWDPRHQTTGARVLVGALGTKPQTHVFWLGPSAPKMLGPYSKTHLKPDYLAAF